MQFFFCVFSRLQIVLSVDIIPGGEGGHCSGVVRDAGMPKKVSTYNQHCQEKVPAPYLALTETSGSI